MISAFGNNVNEYYVNLVRKNFEERAERLKKIRTRTDAEAYIAGVREKIRRIFRFPDRTELDARVTSRRSYGEYSIENVVFFSRPGYPVTANLYLPRNASPDRKVPGALFLCGHSDEGKGSDTYRTVCTGLVLKGFAVFSVDPVEQGERHQYLDVPENKMGLCGNHNLMGKHLALCGEWFGAWRTWDAVRGLDYLASRPEVDASRLCVTGNSGGGTLTAFTAAADSRPVAVAPSCYMTSWKHNFENELPADIEQIPPHVLEWGLEMGDLLLAQAPRKILILGQKNDFFDPRGVRETFEEVARVNDLCGGTTEYFIGPNEHGYHQANREAMYGFFTKQILGSENKPEPAFSLPPKEETFAVENGDILRFPGSRTLRSLTVDIGRNLAARRGTHTPDELRVLLKKLLAVGDVSAPYFRVLRYEPVAEGLFRCRWGLETEPGTVMSVLSRTLPDHACYHIERGFPRLTLRLTAPDAMLEYRAPADGEILYDLDIRGYGEMTPLGTDQPLTRDFFSPYQFDYHYASGGVMLGAPLLGRRVFDILRTLALLKEDGMEITLEAGGIASIPALMAAFLSDDVAHLKVRDLPESYEAMLDNPVSYYPLSCMVSGILEFTDLPELKSAIHEKLI